MNKNLTHCFFAMFDILGFKNLLNQKGTEDLYRLYENHIFPSIQYAAMPVLKNVNSTLVPEPSSLRVKGFQFFSDTIVYYTEDDSFVSFLNIVLTSRELLKMGFAGGKAPYRGAIGYGDLIINNNGILVGTSIIDAYQGEQSQVWSGCILTEQAEKVCIDKNYFKQYVELFISLSKEEKDEINKQIYLSASKVLLKYDVEIQSYNKLRPIEYSIKKFYVLDWTYRVYEGAALNSFYPSINNHQTKIIENTVEFERWARLYNCVNK